MTNNNNQNNNPKMNSEFGNDTDIKLVQQQIKQTKVKQHQAFIQNNSYQNDKK